jgi:hypothetical protein
MDWLHIVHLGLKRADNGQKYGCHAKARKEKGANRHIGSVEKISHSLTGQILLKAIGKDPG